MSLTIQFLKSKKEDLNCLIDNLRSQIIALEDLHPILSEEIPPMKTLLDKALTQFDKLSKRIRDLEKQCLAVYEIQNPQNETLAIIHEVDEDISPFNVYHSKLPDQFRGKYGNFRFLLSDCAESFKLKSDQLMIKVIHIF